MKGLLSALAGLAVLTGVTSAHGEDFTPILEGTWIGTEGEAIFTDGTVTTMDKDVVSYKLVISDQTRSVFKAVQTVTPKGGAELGEHGNEPLVGQSVHMIGAVTATGPFVVLVDVGDTSTLDCQLIDEDSMRCIGSEPGANAYAGTVLLERQ